MALGVEREDLAHALRLARLQLEFDVAVPGLDVGFPVDPALVEATDGGVVGEAILEEDELVPELVHAGQQLHGAVPDVARVVHVLVAHLHVAVLVPHGRVLVVDLEGALIDAARALHLVLLLLPARVAHPDGHGVALEAQRILKLRPLAQLILLRRD